MPSEIKLSGNNGYNNSTELVKAIQENGYNSFANENSHTTIFGEDALGAGTTQEEFINKTKEMQFDENISNSIWEIFDTDGSGDISQEEYDQLIKAYESDITGSEGTVNMGSITARLQNPRKDAKTPQTEKTDTPTQNSNSTTSGVDDEISTTEKNIESQLASEAEKAEEAGKTEETEKTEKSEETTKDGEVSKAMAEIFGKNEKIKQDENGQYYITTDSWDANASENLDCTSRIVKNIYGVSYNSEQGKQITEKLIEANPEFFKNGTELILAGARLNLIDASEILGLDTTEETENGTQSKETGELIETDETKDADGTEETEETKDSKGTKGADGTEETEETKETDKTDGTEGTKGADEADGTEGTKETDETKGTEPSEELQKIQAELDKGKITGQETEEQFTEKLTANFALALAISQGNTDYGQKISDGVVDGSYIEYISINNGNYAASYSALNEDGTKGNLQGMYIYTSEEAVQQNSPAAHFYYDEDGNLHLQTLQTPDGKPRSEEPEDGTEGAQEEQGADSQQQTTEVDQDKEQQIRAQLADERADALNKAADGWGTDEKAIHDVIDNLTGQDLLDVLNTYETKYGVSVESMIEDEFGGLTEGAEKQGLLDKIYMARNYESKSERETVSEQSLHNSHADQILEAADGWGTDEEVFYKLILEGSDEDIIGLASSLASKGEDLTSIIESEFGGWTEGSIKKTLLNKVKKALESNNL